MISKRLTPTQRLKRIAELLEDHDAQLIAIDGPVTQEPRYLREIYLLATQPSTDTGGGE